MAGVLWALGAFGVFSFVVLGTQSGFGTITLALLAAGLVGILVLVRPEWAVVILTSTFFVSYPAALQGTGRLTINNALGALLVLLLAARVAVERRTDFLGVVRFSSSWCSPSRCS